VNYLFDKDEVEKIWKILTDGVTAEFGGRFYEQGLVEPVKRKVKDILDPFAKLHDKEVHLKDIHLWVSMGGAFTWTVQIGGESAEIFKIESPASETRDTTV